MKSITKIIVFLVILLSFTLTPLAKTYSLIENTSKSTVLLNNENSTESDDEDLDVIIPPQVEDESESEDLDIIIPDVNTDEEDEEISDDKKVFENDFSTNCADFSPALKTVGIILLIAKIIIPLIIIVLGTINMFNTITSGGSEELSKVAKSMGMSILGGVLILLAPTIIDLLFKITLNITNQETEYSDVNVCRVCLFHPTSEECEKYVKKAKEESYGKEVKK